MFQLHTLLGFIIEPKFLRPISDFSIFLSRVKEKQEEEEEEEEDGIVGVKCAVLNRFGGGRGFFNDRFWYFRSYCFHSLLRCVH